MNILVSGGSKSGKSAFAERLALRLAAGGPCFYLATMIPCDAEDRARISRHREERAGLGFRTLECGRAVGGCADGREAGAYLLDSVTALLANEMFPYPGEPDAGAPERVAADLRRFADAAPNAVFVSDFLYCDAMRCDLWTERYRRGLALLDRTLAACCGTVLEFCAGTVLIHKGGLPE